MFTWDKVNENEPLVDLVVSVTFLKSIPEVLFSFFEIVVKHVLSSHIVSAIAKL